jgi:MOSC domain-containing protein YiiM
MTAGRIARINVSPGGVPKLPIETARVTELGIEGDGQSDTKNHGGPERALCLYSLERIEALRSEGHPISPGAIGENLTIEGLEWSEISPEDYLLLGERVLVQVTRYTTPCRTITAAFSDGDYARVSHKRYPGDARVYCRVLRGGAIRRGDAVRKLSAAEALASLGRGPDNSQVESKGGDG